VNTRKRAKRNKSRREIKAEDLFKEMIAENFPKLMADTKSQFQKARNHHLYR